MMNRTNIRWNSPLSFIFTASAAAIGLGNIWRFPYMVGQHGGGSFVILYIACVIILGLPLLLAEIVLGRLGRLSPPQTLQQLAKQSLRSPHWRWLGIASIGTAFLITSYYVVITGWVLNYVIKAGLNQFKHITETQSINLFTQLQQHAGSMLLSDTIVVLLSIAVLLLGIKKGLERLILFMFPAMFFLLVLLAIYACTTGALAQSLHYLFAFNIHEIHFNTLLMALSQAFFSLSVAMGVNIMLSAYLPKQVSLLSASIWVALADTLFALLAGMIIFPIVFAHHLQLTAGPSLIFQTLPIAFGDMKFGTIFGTLFFILLFFAAFSSIVALLEAVLVTTKEYFQTSRKKCAIYLGITWWALSLLTIGSFCYPNIFQVFHATWFEIIDFFTAAIMLPVCGFFLAVFTGWFLSKKLIQQDLGWNIQGFWYKIWSLILCYLAPVAILFILIAGCRSV
jgi:neurotransmitter:Na+ symporter, NSS family